MRKAILIVTAGLAITASACSAATTTPANGGTADSGSGGPVASSLSAAASPASPSSPSSPTVSPEGSIMPPTSPAPTGTTRFVLRSGAFVDGGAIPRRYTCDGEDVSPELAWSGAPAGTRSLALIVRDPDAGGFVHWLAYDIPGSTDGTIPNGMSAGPGAPREGTNGFGRTGWGGPCPPSGTHHYVFTLYALDRTLALTGTPRLSAIESAMRDHVIAEATLTGTYRRG